MGDLPKRAKKSETFVHIVYLLAVFCRSQVATAMGEEIMQLPLLLEKFPRPFPTDISGMAAYKSVSATSYFKIILLFRVSIGRSDFHYAKFI